MATVAPIYQPESLREPPDSGVITNEIQRPHCLVISGEFVARHVANVVTEQPDASADLRAVRLRSPKLMASRAWRRWALHEIKDECGYSLRDLAAAFHCDEKDVRKMLTGERAFEQEMDLPQAGRRMWRRLAEERDEQLRKAGR